MALVLKNVLMLAQEHLLHVTLIERTIFTGMALALLGNALMGSQDWSEIGGVACATGLLAMFAGIAGYMLMDGLESQQ